MERLVRRRRSVVDTKCGHNRSCNGKRKCQRRVPVTRSRIPGGTTTSPRTRLTSGCANGQLECSDGSIWFRSSSCDLGGPGGGRLEFAVLMLAATGSPQSRGSGEAILAPCAWFLVYRAFLPLPLGLTDCNTESHRPRGAVGFLFAELAAL